MRDIEFELVGDYAAVFRSTDTTRRGEEQLDSDTLRSERELKEGVFGW